MRVLGRFEDSFQDLLGTLQHLPVRESQHSNALLLEDFGPCRVVLCLFAMEVMAAVDLKRKGVLKAVEVENVGSAGMLATKLHAIESAVAQKSP